MLSQIQSSLEWWEETMKETFSNKIDRVNCPSKKINDKNCPDGHTYINGKCSQVCRMCDYNDNTGYFGDCIPPTKYIKKETEIFDDNYLYFQNIDDIN